MNKEVKKLYRNKHNRIAAGVLAGLGDYLGMDPTVLRLIFTFFTLITGIVPFVILYFIAAIIVPEKS